MYGKLHFGNNPKGVDDFWILPGQGDYINPKFLGQKKDTTITGYVTDVITDLTLNWFKTKRDKNKPFMMMYLHKAPIEHGGQVLRSLLSFMKRNSLNQKRFLMTTLTEELLQKLQK